jgi:Tfp pilus assembly protein FimV
MNQYSNAIAKLNLDTSASQPTLLALYALLSQGAALDGSAPTTPALLLAKLKGYLGDSPQAREILSVLTDAVDRGQL